MKERLMNNISLKILAFLVAVLLWLTVVNIDDPIIDQTYNDIPVSVINAEVLSKAHKTYQIVDDTQTVNVTVKAKRSTLSRIRTEDIVAVADMKELAMESQIPIKVIVKGYDYKEAYSNTRNLQIKMEDEETKKFPIVPKTTGTVRDGYVLGTVEADPEKVSFRGPKSVINKISGVEATVNVSGLYMDTVLQSELTLYDQNNNEIDQTLLSNNLGSMGVDISVQILKTKSVPLEFDTSYIKAAKGYDFTNITYEPQEVRVSGEEDALDQVSKLQIPASALWMEGLTESTEKIVDITSYLPENLELAEENAGSVVVSILVEKDGTKTYEMTVSSLLVENLAENLTMDYKTVDALEVQVRGPKHSLESLDMSGTMSIDLKKFKKPGTYTVPVKVKLPENCALEKQVKVEIELKEYEQEE